MSARPRSFMTLPFVLVPAPAAAQEAPASAPAPVSAPELAAPPSAAPVAEVAPAPAPAPVSATGPAHPKLVSEPFTLTLDGQARPRVVAHTGRDFVGTKKADQVYVTQRARLGATVENTAGMAVVVRLQDVRAWGEEEHPLNDTHAEGFDAHEAYLRVPLGDSLKLTLGRQEIAFDNQRLVGALYGVFLPGELMQGLKGIADKGDLAAEHALYLTTDAQF